MFQMLAHSWLNRRLARVIPNPYLRAAAIAGATLLATRAAQSRRKRPRTA
jgi:hypothetical protein